MNATTTNNPASRALADLEALSGVSDQMRVMLDRAGAEGRDMTPAEAADFKVLTARANGLKTLLRSSVEASAVEFGELQATGERSDADPRRGFAHVGEFASTLVRCHPGALKAGMPMDPRLRPLAAAPGTFAGEGVGADGGVMVPQQFQSEIFRGDWDEPDYLPMCDDIPLTGNSLVMPRDDTTPWDTTTGVQVRWTGEATAITPSKPVLDAADLKLKKLAGLVPASGELLEDAAAMNAWLPAALGSRVRWKTADAIFRGNGAGQPLGALNSAGVVVVAKDTGQATLTLSVTNLANMASRMPPGAFRRATWFVNNDVLPALWTLTLGGQPVFLPLTGNEHGIVGTPVGKIFGRPVVVTQHAKSFSTEGDVMLMDLKHYQAITKAGGMQMATSMHLYFDADAVAFRVTFRMDGQPKVTRPITPNFGSNTLSPFVVLGAR